MAVIIDVNQTQLASVQLPVSQSAGSLPPYIAERSVSNVSETTTNTSSIATGTRSQTSRPSSAHGHGLPLATPPAVGQPASLGPLSSSHSRVYPMTQLQDFMRDLGLHDEDSWGLRGDVDTAAHADPFGGIDDDDDEEESLLIDRGALLELESEDSHRHLPSDSQSVVSPRPNFMSSSPSGIPISPPHAISGLSLRSESSGSVPVSALTMGLAFSHGTPTSSNAAVPPTIEAHEKRKKKRRSSKVIESATNLQVFAQYPVRPEPITDFDKGSDELLSPKMNGVESFYISGTGVSGSSSSSFNTLSPHSFELFERYGSVGRQGSRQAGQRRSLQSSSRRSIRSDAVSPSLNGPVPLELSDKDEEFFSPSIAGSTPPHYGGDASKQVPNWMAIMVDPSGSDVSGVIFDEGEDGNGQASCSAADVEQDRAAQSVNASSRQTYRKSGRRAGRRRARQDDNDLIFAASQLILSPPSQGQVQSNERSGQSARSAPYPISAKQLLDPSAQTGYTLGKSPSPPYSTASSAQSNSKNHRHSSSHNIFHLLNS